MYLRGMDAKLTQVADHQAHKVMTDRWGNRVRIDSYVLKPTSTTVQILAVNLRTAGPNKGVSSYDFRVVFDSSISDKDLTSLPWDDYMSNPTIEEEFGEGSDSTQLIVYQDDNGLYYNPGRYGYPLPTEFSLEVTNPRGDSVKAVELYGGLPTSGNQYYQEQLEDTQFLINNQPMISDGNDSDEWGDDWNQANRYTFIDRYTTNDGSWLMGAFYLIDDNGNLVDITSPDPDKDYLDEVNGIRDCLNPDFNMEMVFLSSEFPGTSPELPDNIENYMSDDHSEAERSAYIESIYNDNISIDVISIPEITTPYQQSHPEVENGGQLVEAD